MYLYNVELNGVLQSETWVSLTNQSADANGNVQGIIDLHSIRPSGNFTANILRARTEVLLL